MNWYRSGTECICWVNCLAYHLYKNGKVVLVFLSFYYSFLNRVRYVWIHANHPLFNLLDAKSKSDHARNWLVFNVNTSFGNSTYEVTHFGPLEFRNDQDSGKTWNSIQSQLDRATTEQGLTEKDFRSRSLAVERKLLKQYLRRVPLSKKQILQDSELETLAVSFPIR